jgi:hypothetical protein
MKVGQADPTAAQEHVKRVEDDASSSKEEDTLIDENGNPYKLVLVSRATADSPVLLSCI